ncbi:MAG: hypothetical protein RL215_498 [Planctomycetota bacterium]
MPVAGAFNLGDREAGEFVGWVELWHANVWEDQISGIADEEGACGGEFASVREVCEFARGFEAAVMPGEFECAGCEFGGGEFEGDSFRSGPDFTGCSVIGRLDSVGEADIESCEDGIKNVATEISECAGAEVLPVAPFEGVVDIGSEWTFGSGAQPEVPVDAVGNGCGFGAGGAIAVLATLNADPGVYFADFTDGTFAEESHADAVFGGGVDLVAHLCGDTGFFGE